MAKVFLPLVFLALADFDRPVTVGLTPQEYKTIQPGDLPKDAVLAKVVQVQEECNALVRGFSVAFKAGKRIKDVALSLALINQDKPVLINLTLAITKDLVLPEVIGKALAEAYPDLLEQRELKAEAVQPEQPPPADGAGPVPPAPAPAKPKGSK